MIIEIKELDKILKKLERIESLMLKNESNSNDPEYITAVEAAEKLGTTTQTLYNHSKKGMFPKYKFGDRTVYYILSEIYKTFKPNTKKI